MDILMEGTKKGQGTSSNNNGRGKDKNKFNIWINKKSSKAAWTLLL